jgi:stage II sporulation SpoAA-like protein
MHFQSGLLKVDASGEFSLEDARQAFREMLGAVVQYKAEKILIDGRNVKGFPTDLERFIYGEFVASETQKIVKKYRIAPRFAYVIHEPLRDSERLAETVAVNRGMDIKIFETSEDAFEWLTKAR